MSDLWRIFTARLETHPEHAQQLNETTLKGVTQGVLFNKHMNAQQRHALRWKLAEQILMTRAHHMPIDDQTLQRDTDAYIRERARTFMTTPEQEWQQASRRFREMYGGTNVSFGYAIGAHRHYYANPINDHMFESRQDQERRQQEIELSHVETQIMLAVHNLDAMTDHEKALVLCQVFYHYSNRHLSHKTDFGNVNHRYRKMYPTDPAFTTMLHAASKYVSDRQMQKLQQFNPDFFPSFYRQVLTPSNVNNSKNIKNIRRKSTVTHAGRIPSKKLAVAALLSAIGIGIGSYTHFRHRQVKTKSRNVRAK